MNIILDTDPAMGTLGIGAEDPEDGFAIMLALRSPELNVKGITVVHGNLPLAHGYSNALHLVNLLGRTDVPVAPGLARPIMPHRKKKHASRRKPQARQFAPTADISDAPVHAVDLIIDTVMNSDGPVTIVAIGPLSNIATALLREPHLARKAERVVIMGGRSGSPATSTLPRNSISGPTLMRQKLSSEARSRSPWSRWMFATRRSFSRPRSNR